ncbi:hypothetical protein BDN72DRAFT_961326 [Pluteus cervinus]|uniref:Uncharacterized protein n=1 Tax=Pluteus cervinus TaxID=181527 RepID=A0ACD3AND8_9AGAR|nr:hypothetical protein BDN72DRAFT_961326 [Pluteus cervinus]
MDTNHKRIRQQIDEEIAILEQRLFALRAQRNHLAPISRLPVEIMSNIFLFAHQGMWSKLSLALSSVSRDWREIAVDLPDLWSRVDSDLKLKHIPEYMIRSGTKPLDIDLPSIPFTSYTSLSAIAQQLPRIRTMHIGGANDSEWVSFSGADWNIAAPILERLELRCFDIPKFIFSGRVPCLRHLTLQKCRIHWNSLPTLPQLTDLHLTRPEALVPVDEFLNQLRLMPCLDSISTTLALTAARTPIQLSHQLPHLTVLYAEEETCADVAQMLQSLILPEVVHFGLRLDQRNPQDQLSIITALQHCSPISTSPITSLIMKARKGFSGYILECEDISALLQFQYSFSSMHDVHSMCTHFNLQKIRELRLDFSNVVLDHQNTPFWSLFQESSDLRKLVVRNEAFTILARYLDDESTKILNLMASSSNHVDTEDCVVDMVSFPLLRELLIRRGARSLGMHTPSLNSIARYLELRYRNGMRLESLVVCSTQPVSDQLKAEFKAVVGRFQRLTQDVKDDIDDLL